jgi:hypothetical protein
MCFLMLIFIYFSLFQSSEDILLPGHEDVKTKNETQYVCQTLTGDAATIQRYMCMSLLAGALADQSG